MRYVIIFLAAATLSGCYSERKAKSQFGKSVTAYPELGATYCGITFPIKEKIVKGDSVITFDTLYMDGDIHFDTVYSLRKDTVYITKVVQGNTIRETIHVTDTIIKENTAKIQALQLDLTKALGIATDKTKEADKWRAIAKKRFWIILGMGAGIALGIFIAVRRKIVKAVPK